MTRQRPAATDVGDSDDVVIGQNVKAAREKLGMSQVALAEEMVKLGLTTWRQTTVSRTERGERSLTYNDVRALQRVLKAPITEGTRAQAMVEATSHSVNTGLARRQLRMLREYVEEQRRQLALLETHIAETEETVECLFLELGRGR